MLWFLGLSSERWARWVRSLSSERWKRRVKACEKLGQLRDVRAVKPLIARLGDRDSSVRQAACEALGKLGEGRLANAVIGALSGDARAREELCRLATQRDVRAVKPLIARLGDRDSSVRQAACEALVAIGRPSVEPLIARLGDRDSSVRQAACEALVAIGRPSVEPLIARLDIGRPSVKPLIARLRDLRDWYSSVRQAACEALGKLGDVRAVEPLIALLGNWDSSVRQAACEALGKLGEGRLANAVIGALSGDARAREELCRLATQRDVRAVELLIARLEDENYYVRKAVCEALNSIYKIVDPQIEGMCCRVHLTRFEKNTIQSGEGDTVRFVACRICGKSDQVMFGVREIIATLDAGMEEEFICANDVVRGNWLKRDALFDFDRVEIIKASDYDVERFCIQVGNDTDNFRNRRYEKMMYAVSPQCRLLENTMRILKGTFGEVWLGEFWWSKRREQR